MNNTHGIQNNINGGLQNIKKMYDDLTFFDQFGSSVIMLIIITIILIVAISYCYAKINAQPIIDDWTNQRCKPQYLPIAGFITHPEGVTATEYTAQNFTYCTQNILSNIAGDALKPLTFVTASFQGVVKNISNSLNAVRGMFDKIRNFSESVIEQIMGRLANVMVPLQQIIISFKDLISKIQGTMTTSLFTLLGSYYTLKSLLGAIAQFIITILISLAASIAIMWAVPFTWGFAAVSTGIFLGIAIPLAIILSFLNDKLNINGLKSIPRIKCFDKNTHIIMNNGVLKKIKDIEVGDILTNNNMVTGKIIVETKGSTMYELDDIFVSDSHIIKYGDKWIPISKHPHAKKSTYYQEPYLYCLNTANKTITINEYIFSDWDEISDEDIDNIKKNTNHLFNEKKDIHKFLDGGFNGNAEVKLHNGSVTQMKDVCVGDILENNNGVYGIVEIDGISLDGQYIYNLGNKIIEGGPNLAICDKNINVFTTLNLLEKSDNYLDNQINYKKSTNKIENKLYHLLTNKKTISINNIRFYDYNASIDLFLDKSKGKLLSMKYV
jgi:hypothetical protein